MAYFDKNDMAAALTIFLPTSAFECANRFRSRVRRKLGHRRLTSTLGRQQLAAFGWLPWFGQPTIASRMLAMASCSVLPWEIHPGMEDARQTKVTVSSHSRVTSNFIETNFTCESLVRQLSLLDSPDPRYREERKRWRKRIWRGSKETALISLSQGCTEGEKFMAQSRKSSAKKSAGFDSANKQKQAEDQQ